MKYIIGQDRNQVEFVTQSLDETIAHDNEVRLIDVFVDSLKLEELGFEMDYVDNGRPAYHPGDLLKLYIYGYLNRIRSSRQLEKECYRNIEVIWLMKNLQPDHNTISNFRRDNPKAIKRVFRKTVEIAKFFELIGGKLLAGDSTKLRAQNSKKNNYNQKKINRHLEYIQNKLDEHQKALAESDGDSVAKQHIEQEIAKHKSRQIEYHELEKQLNESGEVQISTSDPESRQMITRNNITEVAYNVQTTVDAEHNIPIDYKVTNENDSKAMGKMLPRAKSILGHNQFTSLYDKGYHTGSEFAIADRLGLEVLVAVPGVAANAPDPAYNVENFKYNPIDDFYICPQGSELHSNGTWYESKAAPFKQYKTADCKTCSVRDLCTKSAKNGKIVQRNKYADLIEANRHRIEQNKDYYRRRQSIVEHPYGTIKRQWGFSYIMTKRTMQRASADVGLIFIAYNLRRILNIIGIETFRRYLLALLAVLGSILASIEAFCRGLKNLPIFYNQKLTYRRMDLIPIFVGQFCNKTKLLEGF